MLSPSCCLVFLVYIAHSFLFVSSANPNYSYHVKIQDPVEANYQEKAETRKGDYTEGFYRFVSLFYCICLVKFFITSVSLFLFIRTCDTGLSSYVHTTHAVKSQLQMQNQCQIIIIVEDRA